MHAVSGIPNAADIPVVAGISITPARLNPAGNPVVSGIPIAAGVPILARSPIIVGNPDVSGVPFAASIPTPASISFAAGIPSTAGISILAGSPIIGGNPVAASIPIAAGIPAARIPFGERRAARVVRGPPVMAIGLSLLSAISLGSGAVSGRAGMTGVHPVAVIGIALVVGFVSATIVSAVLYPSALFGVPASALPWIAFFGLVQFAVGRTTAYIGLSTIGASRVALFISTQVPFAAFFAIAFTGESLTALVAGGTVAVTLGLLLASGDSLTQGWRTDRSYLIGCIAGLTAGAATGASTVLAKQAVEVYDSPLVVSSLGMLAAMFIVVPVVSAIAARSPAVRSFDRRSMAFVWLSGLCTTGSIVAQLFAVQRADVVIVAPILATFPLWTLLLSHIFISRLEQITLRLTIGTVVAVAGVIAVAVGGQL